MCKSSASIDIRQGLSYIEFSEKALISHISWCLGSARDLGGSDENDGLGARALRKMKIKEIAEALDASLLVGGDQMDTNITKCGASDLMSDILAGLSEGCVLLTGLATVQVVRTAMIAGVGAIVFVRGKTPPPEVIEMAEAQGIPVLSTAYSMFVSCGRLYSNNLTGLTGAR